MTSEPDTVPSPATRTAVRILVVDDNRAIHDDFRKILGHAPAQDEFDALDAEVFGGTPAAVQTIVTFSLDFAFQGDEALGLVKSSLVEKDRYSIVFMDVRMPPGWNGIETTSRLWEVDPDLQVVICTAYSDLSWGEMVAELGHSDRFLILKKPFDPIEVIQCAHSLSKKWEMLQRNREHTRHLEKNVRLRTTELEAANDQLAAEAIERQRVMGDLADARDFALESARLKSRFLANMSHEIRTPMNGIIGMAELLGHTSLDAGQTHYVETIRSSADLLLDIVNDILDLSKIEAGKLTFQNRPFVIHELVEGSLDVVAAAAAAKNIELAGIALNNIPYYLKGDMGRLRQVVTNLLGNAVKFTDRGEVTLHVSLAEETEFSATLSFEVVDTGIGISKASLGSVFDPFSQADDANNRKYGGTGLGLAICRQIVEALGGRIGVTSQPDRGSTFWFVVTLEKPTPACLVRPTLPSLPKELRVIAVDDNANNRTILSQQLANLGIAATVVEKGDQAISALRQHQAADTPFHIAILDMNMPGQNGIELAREIALDTSFNTPRKILLSSIGEHPGEGALSEARIDAFLTKPIKQTQLRKALHDIFAPEDATPPESAPAPSSAQPSPPVRPLSILLAEDNLVNQQVTLLQLARLGHQADIANNGVEVLSALEKKEYDVILMDCQMPVMGGYTATREVRSRYGRNIRVIALTANAMEGDREKCLEAGMDDYLSKPFSGQDLVRVLGLVLPGSPAVAEPHSAPPPVNIERFREITGGDPRMFRQIATDYLRQAEEILDEIGSAISSGAEENVRLLAHKLSGSSSTCGMTPIAATLRLLENGSTATAPDLHRTALDQLGEIRAILALHLANDGRSDNGSNPDI